MRQSDGQASRQFQFVHGGDTLAKESKFTGIPAGSRARPPMRAREIAKVQGRSEKFEDAKCERRIGSRFRSPTAPSGGEESGGTGAAAMSRFCQRPRRPARLPTDRSDPSARSDPATPPSPGSGLAGLLPAKGLDRAHPRRPPSRQVAGQHGDRPQQDRHRPVGQRVVWIDAEEEA